MKARRYLHGSTITVTALGDGGQMFAGSFEVIQLRVECEHQRSGCSFRIIALEGDGTGVQITEEQHDALKRHVLKHAPDEPKPSPAWRSSLDTAPPWLPSIQGYLRMMGYPAAPPEPPKPPPPRKYDLDCTESLSEADFKRWALKRGGEQPIDNYHKEAAREYAKLGEATSHNDAIYRARAAYFRETKK